MTMLPKIENDINVARRERDARRLKVLTLLMSKIQLLAKDDGNRAIREDGPDVKDGRNDVIDGVNRYRKEVVEMRDALVKLDRATDEQDYELSIVNAYLPSQMSDAEVDAEIEKALEGLERGPKAMGAVMKHLNEGFKGKFDAKTTSARVKAMLT